MRPVLATDWHIHAPNHLWQKFLVTPYYLPNRIFYFANLGYFRFKLLQTQLCDLEKAKPSGQLV